MIGWNDRWSATRLHAVLLWFNARRAVRGLGGAR